MLRLRQLDLPTARLALWLLGIGNLLSVLRAPASVVFAASGDFAYVTLISAGVSFLNTVAAVVAVSLGAGPLVVAGLYFALYGVAAAVFFHVDVRIRRALWAAAPAWPTRAEFSHMIGHVKWFALQLIAPTVWLQTPVIVFDYWGAAGGEIAAFLLMRTMVNQIRQSFPVRRRRRGGWRSRLQPRRRFRPRLVDHRRGRPDDDGDRGGLRRRDPRVRPGAHLLLVGRRRALQRLRRARHARPAARRRAAATADGAAAIRNASREIGLLRLGLILFGPLGCVLGEALAGPTGLAIGLGVAEVSAYAALAPRLAAMPRLPGFRGYMRRTMAIGVAAAALCTAAGFAIKTVAPPTTLPLFSPTFSASER